MAFNLFIDRPANTPPAPICPEPGVDAATRTAELRAGVLGARDRLRPGTFVRVEIALPKRAPEKIVVAPATAAERVRAVGHAFERPTPREAGRRARQQAIWR